MISHVIFTKYLPFIVNLHHLLVCFLNIGNSTQNFLTFSFNPFCHTGAKFQRSYLDPVPNIGLEAKAPLKKSWFLWSNPYKIGVIKNSFIEMLKLPNFDYMTTST